MKKICWDQSQFLVPPLSFSWSPSGWILEGSERSFVKSPGFTHGETEARGQRPGPPAGSHSDWGQEGGAVGLLRVIPFPVIIEQIWRLTVSQKYSGSWEHRSGLGGPSHRPQELLQGVIDIKRESQ